MPKVNIIECKTKDVISAFPFIPVMTSESTTARNINVFEELNINQLSLAKDDFCFDKLFYIWWGNLKTEVQILSMQNYGLEIGYPYNQY